MASTKVKAVYVCQECGAQSPRWVGRCQACGSWNSYVEEAVRPPASDRSGRGTVMFEAPPVLLKDIVADQEKRLVTGIAEFDRVLGGGIVPGSVTLIGGDPGIGKSTLTLQAALRLSRRGLKVLVVSGEESVQQAKMRADRLDSEPADNLLLVNQIDLDLIRAEIQRLKPDVAVIDSIQVVYLPEMGSSAGSVSQVRECSALLTQLAKTMRTAVFIVGHVTKDGMIAGPRVLEHIVDTVLYLEGERYTSYRVLRSMKNRFGGTHEMGVFEMTSAGLKEVRNPSEIFLSERPQNTSGSVVVPILEGTRPFLVEVQGLVSRSGYGMVRQKAQGFDPNRLALLTAVLEKRLEMNLQDKDVFLNIAGGVRVIDPAADLGVVMAVASALLDKPLADDTAVVGEVGLSSEVRSVSQLVLRLKEAAKLGFKRCIVPKNNMKTLPDAGNENITLIPVENVRQALDYL